MSAWQRRRAAAKEEGATAVEFALIFPLVVLVCFFALYCGLFFFYSAVADHVARTVARQVSIPVGATGTTYPDANPATVVSDAKSAAGSLIPNPSAAIATSSPTGTPSAGDLVTVSVTYKLPVISGFPGFSSLATITRSASERRQ